jgi:hypothetical protein
LPIDPGLATTFQGPRQGVCKAIRRAACGSRKLGADLFDGQFPAWAQSRHNATLLVKTASRAVQVGQTDGHVLDASMVPRQGGFQTRLNALTQLFEHFEVLASNGELHRSSSYVERCLKLPQVLYRRTWYCEQTE